MKHYFAALSSNSFFSQVANAEEDKVQSSSLRKFCEGMLQQAVAFPLNEDDAPEGAKDLMVGCGEAMQAFKCLISLCVPIRNYMDTTTEDAVFLTSLPEDEENGLTKDAALFVKPIIGALNSSEFWTGQVDAVVSHGASSAEHATLLKELQVENQAVIDQDEPDESLMKLIKQLPTLKAAFRPGATDELEKILSSRLEVVVAKLMQRKPGEIDVATVPSLEAGLALVTGGQNANLTNLQLRFKEWKTGLAGDLACLRLQNKAQAFSANLKDLNLMELGAAITEIEKKNLGPDLLEDLKKLTELIFSNYLTKAPALNLV